MSQESEEKVDVGQILPHMIEVLTELAWQKMGLRADPMTGKTERDLEQAKMAVDGVNALAEIILAKLDDADQRRLRNIMTDLRLNFVQQKEMAGQ